jgi:hypothetical protein
MSDACEGKPNVVESEKLHRVNKISSLTHCEYIVKRGYGVR